MLTHGLGVLTFACIHARIRPDELDEAALRKEGYDRCFKERIYALYQQNTEMSVEEVDRIVERSKDNLEDTYRELCFKYQAVPGIPMWVPPYDRPDWLPEFLLQGQQVDAKDEDEVDKGTDKGEEKLSRPRVRSTKCKSGLQ